MSTVKRVQKPDTVRDLGPVDIGKLLGALEQVPDRIWEHEDSVKDNPFACFHQSRHIIFRFVHRDNDPWNFAPKPLWAVWQPLLLPVMRQAIAPYAFVDPVFPKAMLARLRAHGEIKRHRDGPGTNLVTHKIHVPLQTNALAMFEAGDAVVHLERGRAYEVNNVGPHAVRNGGDQDRIHFIFEVFEGAAEEAHAAAGRSLVN